MNADGLNYCQIARHLKVSHGTVMNWVKARAEQLPEAPSLAGVYSVDIDELFTLVDSFYYLLG
jgi:transposase-like protein